MHLRCVLHGNGSSCGGSARRTQDFSPIIRRRLPPHRRRKGIHSLIFRYLFILNISCFLLLLLRGTFCLSLCAVRYPASPVEILLIPREPRAALGPKGYALLYMWAITRDRSPISIRAKASFRVKAKQFMRGLDEASGATGGRDREAGEENKDAGPPCRKLKRPLLQSENAGAGEP